MARYIDADALTNKMEAVMDMQDTYLPIHFKEWVVDETPTADVVEVVRCKDCKHYKTDGWCIWDGEEWKPDEFCSRGERREKRGEDEQT